MGNAGLGFLLDLQSGSDLHHPERETGKREKKRADGEGGMEEAHTTVCLRSIKIRRELAAFASNARYLKKGRVVGGEGVFLVEK